MPNNVIPFGQFSAQNFEEIFYLATIKSVKIYIIELLTCKWQLSKLVLKDTTALCVGLQLKVLHADDKDDDDDDAIVDNIDTTAIPILQKKNVHAKECVSF